jgi:biopolymer transport protein TolR|tara:strand:+ start:3297 stop:3737 length:441 start_codon:yes stop_codon:yes gene_type:complete
MEILVRKKRKPMADINVVPYIDVMLVLLIVFMVTAPMLNQGIEVDLPQANNEPVDIDENLETLVVSIKADGSFFLSIGATGEEAQSLELSVLGDQVRRVVGANPDIQVLIEGDREADWGTMITLITTLQQAGVDNPNFITEPISSL